MDLERPSSSRVFDHPLMKAHNVANVNNIKDLNEFGKLGKAENVSML